MATTVKKRPSTTATKARKGKTKAKNSTNVKTTTKSKAKNSTKPKRPHKQEPPYPLPIFLEKKHEAITNLLYQIDEQALAEVWCWVFGYDLDGDDYGPDLDAVPDDIGEVIDALADEAYEVIRDEDVDGLTEGALLDALNDLR
jgi:hypothetical protein